MLNNALVFLNIGERTHFNVGSGTFSGIKLLICSPVLAPRLSWNVLQTSMGDLFPVRNNANAKERYKHTEKMASTVLIGKVSGSLAHVRTSVEI